MKCTDCEHFNILYPPYRSGGILWDTGRAECTKYNLVIDTVSKKQISKLVCVEASTEEKPSPPRGGIPTFADMDDKVSIARFRTDLNVALHDKKNTGDLLISGFFVCLSYRPIYGLLEYSTR